MTMALNEKKSNVPLEEALNISGTGMYTNYLIFSIGFLFFCGMLNIEAMAMVLPAAGCDLQLTSTEKGILASMLLAGMLVTGPLSGFLADAFGRKSISFWGQASSSILLLLSSVAPNIAILMVLCFVNGIALTGSFTPSYVLLGEFCPAGIRGRAIVISTTLSTLANIGLPGLAWLIMPLDVNVPVYDIFTFTSWRLFLVILAIPNFMVLLFLWSIPETPKFLLNAGDHEATMNVLRRIYAVNMKKKAEDYPVLSVVLDRSDEGYEENAHIANPFLRSATDMISRTRLLFSRKFIVTTIIISIAFFTQIGSFYTFMLWFPELTSRIVQYASHNDIYNVTVCDLMSSKNVLADVTGDCQLNYGFFIYGILFGIVQVITGISVSFYADRASKKLLLACFMVTSALLCSIFALLNDQYLTLGALTLVTAITGIGFPVIVALIMESYPTYVRSTASAVGIIFGRLGASAGNQLMGLLYDNYCNQAYFGLTGILIVTAILCLAIPTKKKS